MVQIKLDLGEFQVFDNYVVVIMNEGITVEPEHNDVLVEISEKYFSNRPFGYITIRKNSYGVNPLVYLSTSKLENLVAFAVVCNDGLKESNLKIEKLFFKKPFKHFKELKDAEKWVNDMVEISEV